MFDKKRVIKCDCFPAIKDTKRVGGERKSPLEGGNTVVP
jgi:hypothetical protein